MQRLALAAALLFSMVVSANAGLSASVRLEAATRIQETMPVTHNGSRAIYTRDSDNHVEIRYDVPRRGLPVRSGELLFSGTYDVKTRMITGLAYLFKRGCGPTPYPVAGLETDPGIVLVGAAPVRDRNPISCAILGAKATGSNARLEFAFEYGDE